MTDDRIKELRECAESWEPDVTLLGNVTAADIIGVCDEIGRLRARVEGTERVSCQCEAGDQRHCG